MTATRPTGAANVKVVRPGEGAVGVLGNGVGVQFKIDGADTGGLVSIVEHPFDVGALVAPHVHHREDEVSYVLEGEIGFRSDDDEVVLAPGGYIVKPRGQVHAMWNAGRTPARMIEVITTAGFEDFFREVAALVAGGATTPEQFSALAERYALPFAEPAWLPDVIERYGLHPTG